MLYFIIGLPGHFTEWCDAAAVAIARRVLGPTEFVRGDTLEEIALVFRSNQMIQRLGPVVRG